jgi:transposase InsO family protein
VPERSSAQWTARQIVDAFPDDSAPPYLRDRDSVYGHASRPRVRHLGIEELLTAPRSPWQNPFAERLIGSGRREYLSIVTEPMMLTFDFLRICGMRSCRMQQDAVGRVPLRPITRPPCPRRPSMIRADCPRSIRVVAQAGLEPATFGL